jgi:hypothetical protein
MARRMENATVGEREEEGKGERSGIGDPCEYPLRSIHNTTKALPQEPQSRNRYSVQLAQPARYAKPLSC